MPTYFLDIEAGPQTLRDNRGSEHSNIEAARRELVSAMTQILHESVAAKDSRDIVGHIRDAGGAWLYTATLQLKCQDMRATIKLGASTP